MPCATGLQTPSRARLHVARAQCVRIYCSFRQSHLAQTLPPQQLAFSWRFQRLYPHLYLRLWPSTSVARIFVNRNRFGAQKSATANNIVYFFQHVGF